MLSPIRVFVPGDLSPIDYNDIRLAVAVEFTDLDGVTDADFAIDLNGAEGRFPSLQGGPAGPEDYGSGDHAAALISCH